MIKALLELKTHNALPNNSLYLLDGRACRVYFSYITNLQLIEFTHGIGLNVVCNIDVGLHRLVVAVPRPLHHDLRRDTQSKGITDKGTTTSMRTEQGIFRRHLFDALVPFVVGLADRFVDTSSLASSLI